jgi:hypothetical protein
VTQHHDPVHPDDDETAEHASALTLGDEELVRTLLADLPALTMPADVSARLHAALAAEAATRPVAAAAADEDAQAAPDTDAPVATSDGAVAVTATVVPIQAGRRPPRRTRVLQVAAVAVLVVAGGALAVRTLGSGSTGQSTTASAANPERALTHSGHVYTEASLMTDAGLLATHGRLPTQGTGNDSQKVSSPPPGTQPASGETGQPSPVTTGTSTAQLFAVQSELVSCLVTLEDTAKISLPLAMDTGYYRGQPAMVVVFPSSVDPATKLDVFVVGASCGLDGNEALLIWVSAPRG